MKPYIIFQILVAVLISMPAISQDFVISRVELDGGNVNIYYDLVDTVKSRTYTVEVYTSRDNFVSRLEKLTGDQGLEVKPGGNRKITWAANEELGADFEGKVGLEVRGRVYIPFVRIEGLNKAYKRGRSFPVTWTGGTQQNILNFDLYRGKEKIHPINNIANAGRTDITIPSSVRPGEYYFKVTDSKNKDQEVNSQPFLVKRKVPLILKVASLVGVGVAIAVVTSNPQKNNDIPDPLDPTSIHN